MSFGHLLVSKLRQDDRKNATKHLIRLKLLKKTAEENEQLGVEMSTLKGLNTCLQVGKNLGPTKYAVILWSNLNIG